MTEIQHFGTYSVRHRSATEMARTIAASCELEFGHSTGPTVDDEHIYFKDGPKSVLLTDQIEDLALAFEKLGWLQLEGVNGAAAIVWQSIPSEPRDAVRQIKEALKK